MKIGRLLDGPIRESRKSVLLLGPRQTGKSTLLESLKPELTIQLAREETFLEFSSDPAALEKRLRAAPSASSILIDEIQRVPNLMNTLQAIIDDDKRDGRIRKFYLSGSSARKLKRGNANLLPGRVFVFELGPLCSRELDYKLDQDRALAYGTLPEPYLEGNTTSSERHLRGYAGAYLKEEIENEATLKGLQGLGRLLQILARTAGQNIDQTKLAREARVSRNMIPRYLDLLEDTLVLKRVYPWTETDADLTKHPRAFFFDVGVTNGLLGNFIVSEDRKGLLFEQLFFSQLLASAKAQDIPIEVSSFRTRGGLEVDFVVRVHGQTTLVELKAGTSIHSGDVQALLNARRSAREPEKVQLLLGHLGEHPLRLGEVDALPWQMALKKIGL